MNEIATVDLSAYSQAKSAANAMQNLIEQIAEDIGQSPEIEVTLKDEGGKYVLYWEGGPANWAVDAMGGSGLVGAHVDGQLAKNNDMWVEPKNTFAIEFGNY